ncbi:MAG TPA: coproporphyrinogen III oxidase, partial [Gammaproteobacteria bacterium]|nr:coproporphyrinogen III oxidase [Gammaproteobacteria bacterium]
MEMRLGLPHLMPQAGVVIVDFDADLIQRYDCSGPRYTSYPTARQFESHFDPERYKQEVAKSNDDPVPSGLSVYVHLPYCSSPCFYCGCTRLITRDIQKVARYLDRLLQEAALQGRLFDGDREVQQLHLGGGTPTMLTDDQLSLLWEGLRNS